MSITVDQLYNLLPSIYRRRDLEQGQPLRALLDVLAKEAARVEQDIDELYANWFIETCEEWVVPYIGDLLGVRGLNPTGRYGISQRALVANTIRYRRQKGSLALLEALARDVTGWPAHAVELYRQLGVTQHLDHLRLNRGRMTALCDSDDPAQDRLPLDDPLLMGAAFDTATYTADLRHPDQGAPRWNLPNIALFLWRMQSYWLTRAEACSLGDDRYTFSPLGHTAPLFNCPDQFKDGLPVSGEIAMPGRLRRHAFRAGSPWMTSRVPFAIEVNGRKIEPAEMAICNLSEWTWPQQLTPAPLAAVDPELGRFMLRKIEPSETATAVLVDYAYGFPMNLGGGPYDRSQGAENAPVVTIDAKDKAASQAAKVTWITVGRDMARAAEELVPATQMRVATLADALVEWDRQKPEQCIIQIDDSGTYRWDAPLEIQLRGRQLTIQARNEQRPVLAGSINVVGGGAAGELTLRGLLIDGALTVRGTLQLLLLEHCTLAPDCHLTAAGIRGEQVAVEGTPARTPSLTIDSNGKVDLVIDHCITGALRLPAGMRQAVIRDSIVDAQNPGRFELTQDVLLPAIAAGRGAGPDLQIERTTVLGDVHVTRLSLAKHVLFAGKVRVEPVAPNCVRYCYLPADARIVGAERCQPDATLGREAADRVRPQFVSTRYGQPGYAQLSDTCPGEIRRGGEDETEIGAFHALLQPVREANLRFQLQEYLRAGLTAGLIFAGESQMSGNHSQKRLV